MLSPGLWLHKQNGYVVISSYKVGSWLIKPFPCLTHELSCVYSYTDIQVNVTTWASGHHPAHTAYLGYRFLYSSSVSQGLQLICRSLWVILTVSVRQHMCNRDISVSACQPRLPLGSVQEIWNLQAFVFILAPVCNVSSMHCSSCFYWLWRKSRQIVWVMGKMNYTQKCQQHWHSPEIFYVFVKCQLWIHSKEGKGAIFVVGHKLCHCRLVIWEYTVVT